MPELRTMASREETVTTVIVVLASDRKIAVIIALKEHGGSIYF